MLRVDRYAGHRANLHALRLIEVAYAFCAFVRVNLVDVGAHVNSLVGAFGLAHVAVDAFVGDQQGHGVTCLSPCSPVLRRPTHQGPPFGSRRRPAC